MGGIQVLVGRLSRQDRRLDPSTAEEAISTLFMLTSFESFDALASGARSREDVVPVILRLARAALGVTG